MDVQSRDQLRFDRKICSKKCPQKHLDPGADFVLVNCAFLALVGGLALPYNILPFMCTESLAGSQDPLFCLFFSTARDFRAGLLCFLNETWRFLVLVLCWSLVLF